MCIFFSQGVCKYGAKCLFAHEQGDVAPLPDLKNTRICTKFEAGNCNEENCPFAHSQDELRSTDFFYKTTACMWHAAGKCRNGEQCRFAHGDDDLRKVVGSERKKAVHANSIAKQARDQAAKQSVKESNSTAKEDKDTKKSNNRRTKQKDSKKTQKIQTSHSPEASKGSLSHQSAPWVEQPMFIEPDRMLMQSSMPNYMSSPAQLPDYQQIPGCNPLLPGISLGLPQPQAPFPPYVGPYPAAASPGFSDGREQDIATLTARIKSLSGQLKQIQKYVGVAGELAAGDQVNGAAGQSDSTKSGSYSRSQSSGDSSSPSTPPLQKNDSWNIPLCELERLNWQLHMAAMAQGMAVGRPPLRGTSPTFP
jgi:hypothetical protein